MDFPKGINHILVKSSPGHIHSIDEELASLYEDNVLLESEKMTARKAIIEGRVSYEDILLTRNWRISEQERANKLSEIIEVVKRSYEMDKTFENYEQTYGGLFQNISRKHCINISGQYLKGCQLCPAMPDGDELWCSIQYAKTFGSLMLLGTDSSRVGNPDLLDKKGYIDIKTPKSIKTVRNRLRTARKQYIAMGQKEARVILSSLRYVGDFSEAVNEAAKRLDLGRFYEVVVIWPGGRIQLMRKGDQNTHIC